jgi:hypothetical protein
VFLHILWMRNPARQRFIRHFFIFLAGTVLFSGLVLLYLFIFSLQGSFWELYIRQNLFYLNMIPVSLFEKLFHYWPFIGLVEDTYNLFGLTGIILALGILVFMGRRSYQPADKTPPSSFVFVYYSLAFLAVSIYAAIKPGRGYSHHLLFLIIPAGFILGVFLAELRKILEAQGAIRHNIKLALSATVVAVIVITNSVEVSARTLIGGPYIVHTGKLIKYYVSPVIQAILKHASAGDSLAVWGWAPELYVDSGLVQAIKQGNLMYEIAPNARQQYFLQQFTGDLLNSRADIFVDAVAPGRFAFYNRKTEGFDAFPEVRGIVEKYYNFAEEVSGVRIYVRKPEAKPPEKTLLNRDGG